MTDPETQIPAVVEVDHSFFKAFSEPYFAASAPPDEEPVFRAMLGEQAVSLPLRGIIRELRLEDGAPLRVMLDTIMRSLQYVNALRIGDDIPAEVRSGEASWEAAPQYLETARQRLTMQLVTTLTGQETVTTDPQKLQLWFDDPATGDAVAGAFAEAAGQLGLAGPEQVAAMIDEFAEELSYVEALRATFTEIRALLHKIDALRKYYSDQSSIFDDINPVVRLMKKPVADFQESFERIDVQTSKILAMLREPDAQRVNIRGVRDRLHVRFVAWQQFVDTWRDVDPLYPQEFNVGNGLRDLYRFLAQRYMAPDEWVLMASLRDAGEGDLRYGGVMTW